MLMWRTKGQLRVVDILISPKIVAPGCSTTIKAHPTLRFVC